ncbi:hypothetical protein BC834DRAFT_861669 [Gloeopeniophorella convolvens]|nr:hypothetical protein BC834DRAFT_861669 [Gloeopeniophorella convolvens]
MPLKFCRTRWSDERAAGARLRPRTAMVMVKVIADGGGSHGGWAIPGADGERPEGSHCHASIWSHLGAVTAVPRGQAGRLRRIMKICPSGTPNQRPGPCNYWVVAPPSTWASSESGRALLRCPLGHICKKLPERVGAIPRLLPPPLPSPLTSGRRTVVPALFPSLGLQRLPPPNAEMGSEANTLFVTVKLLHVFGGIYIWEWASTVHFEWEVFTGQRPFRWSFVAYELCRTLALCSIATSFAGFNLTHEFNCNAWFRVLLVSSYFAIAFSSLLILLRGVAIWGRSTNVLIFTAIVWLCNVGFALYSVTRAKAVWDPTINACAITKTKDFRWGIMVNLITDLTLLSVMFAGVINKRNATGLWRVLYLQGLAWIFMASLSEIPPVVLSWLNISDGWNLMFQTPHLVIIVIMATRVYRDLFEYINPSFPTSQRLPHPPRVNVSQGQVQVKIHKTVDVDLGSDLLVSESSMTRGEREAKQMRFIV